MVQLESGSATVSSQSAVLTDEGAELATLSTSTTPATTSPMTTTSRQDNNRVMRSAGRRLPLCYQDFYLANMARTLQDPIGACIELLSLARAYAALNLSSIR